ncbi:MAG: hypothetical protein ACYCU5_05705 [Actinomycetes bacterium]
MTFTGPATLLLSGGSAPTIVLLNAADASGRMSGPSTWGPPTFDLHADPGDGTKFLQCAPPTASPSPSPGQSPGPQCKIPANSTGSFHGNLTWGMCDLLPGKGNSAVTSCTESGTLSLSITSS